MSNNMSLFKLSEDYHSEHAKAGVAITALWLGLEALSATVGSCPTCLAFEYLAPSAWVSIGAVATKLDGLKTIVTIQGVHLDHCKPDAHTLAVDLRFKGWEEKHQARSDDFKAIITAVRALGGRLDNVELNIVTLVSDMAKTNASLERVPIVTQGSTTDRLSRFRLEDLQAPARAPSPVAAYQEPEQAFASHVESRILAIEAKMSGLLAKNDDRASLGFWTIANSNAWLETELRKHPSSLIVNVHMVLEHIHYALEGIDTIATMEKVYKIKVTCIADSVAMTLFDTKTPKFFCKVQGH